MQQISVDFCGVLWYNVNNKGRFYMILFAFIVAFLRDLSPNRKKKRRF